MRLCYAREGDGPFVGLESEERWFNLSMAIKGHPDRFPWVGSCLELRIEEILANVPDLGGTLVELLNHLDSSGTSGIYRIDAPQELLPPITRPSKIIGLGRNYLGHAQETGLSVPDEPLIFAKAPSSIIGPGANIVYPPVVTRLDPWQATPSSTTSRHGTCRCAMLRKAKRGFGQRALTPSHPWARIWC
jgi:hypothetical protein